MKAVRIVVVIAAVLCLWPEAARYRGERQLARLEAVSQLLRARTDLGARRLTMLRGSSRTAQQITTYPGDWRPLTSAGSMMIHAGDPESAVALFRRALLFGERPEIDVNLASALRMMGEERKADDLVVRAIWLSPAVAAHVAGANRIEPLRRVVAMETMLRQGMLKEQDFPAEP